MLNSFRPHLWASGGVEYMKTLDSMKVTISFTSLLFMQPNRKVRSAWTAGSESFSRFLMCL